MGGLQEDLVLIERRKRQEKVVLEMRHQLHVINLQRSLNWQSHSRLRVKNVIGAVMMKKKCLALPMTFALLIHIPIGGDPALALLQVVVDRLIYRQMVSQMYLRVL